MRLVVLLLILARSLASGEGSDSLPQGAVLRLGSAALSTSTFVHAVGFLPDGRTVASLGTGLQFWDVETGRARRDVPIMSYDGSFSPDGAFFLGAGPFKSELVDLEKGEVVGMLGPPGGLGGQSWAAMSNGAERVAIASEEGTVSVLEEGGKKELWSDTVRGGRLSAVALSADGASLAIAAGAEVSFWEAETGRRVRSWRVSEARTLAFSPDGRRLAVGRNYARTTVLDVGEDGKKLFLDDEPAARGPVAFSPDGARLATGGKDGVVQVWDVTTGELVARCERHDAPVFCVAFSPDGRTVASGSSDQTIRLWDAATGKERVPHEGHSGLVMGVAFTPDARRIVSCDFHTSVRVWDARDGREVRRIEGKRTLALSADGKVLACGGPGEAVQLVELSTGKRLDRLAINPYEWTGLLFSPDGRALVARHSNGRCQVWDTERARPLEWRPSARGVHGLAITPDGTRCLLATASGSLRCVRWGVERIEWAVTPSNSPQGVAVSPDGRLAATVSPIGDVELFAVGDGRAVGAIDAMSDPPTSWSSGDRHRIDFCPEDGYLVSFDKGGVVRLYELASQSLLVARQTETRQAFSSAMAPRGTHYAVGGMDGVVTVWDLLALEGTGASTSPDDLWRDTASTDPGVAYRAMCGLAALGPRGVETIRRGLGPAEAATTSVEDLIRDLDADDIAVREAAARSLGELGEEAREGLEDCLRELASPEARSRASGLLEDLDSGRIRDADALRASRAVWVLEGIGSPEARKLLKRLAKGATEARLTRQAAGALDRLK